MKNLSGAAKYSVAFLALVTLVFVITLSMGVSADTDSEVTVIPNITAGGMDDQPFEATVTAGEGHTVHEFRVYESGDFSDLKCDSKTNWYGPYYGTTGFGNYCQWNAYEDYEIQPGTSEKFYFTMDSPGGECCRVMRTEPRDLEQSWQPKFIDICVDTTPPETTKYFDGPQKKDGYVEWIDSETYVVLEATDTVGPHDAGIDKIWYVNIWSPECDDPCLYSEDCIPEYYCRSPYDMEYYEGCIDECQEGCDGLQSPEWEECVEMCVYNPKICNINCNDQPWKVARGDYTELLKEEESCHVLLYFAVDGVGNVEDMNANCFFVDKTPPERIKTIGDPQYGNCLEDVEPELCEKWDCFSGITKDFFVTGRYGDNNPTAGAWELAIWEVDGGETVVAQDNHGWTSDVEFDFSVSYDPSDGMITYTADGETLQWTYDGGKAFEYIIPFAKGNADGSVAKLTNMQLNGMPLSDLSSDIGSPYYWGLKVPLSDANQVSGFTLIGKAKLTWGKTANEIPGFHVYAMETHEPEDCWVRDDTYMEGTPITLDCVDPEPHPSGDEEVCYKVSLDGDDVTESHSYCDEKLEEITQQGHEGFWCCVPAPKVIVFKEDSLHDLEYFCRDAVNKKSDIDLEWFRVDSQHPIIEKDMFGYYLGDCPSGTDIEHGDCYVADDGSSGVDITVYDDDTYPECAVDDLYCYYDLTWILPTGERIPIEENYEFSTQAKITFTKDSTHELYIYCEDALGNYVEHTEYFLVDSTPPETEKEYVGPQKVEPICEEWCDTYSDYPEDCKHFTCTMWITSDTEVHLDSYDEKVGVEKIMWRDLYFPNNDEICYRPPHVIIDRDGAIYDECNPTEYMKYVGDQDLTWNEVYDDETMFKKSPESCHVIEYYAVDKLGNEELLKWQCVFVDNTAPYSVKTHGEPLIPDDGFDWVTQDTWIRLDCVDPEPHPVDQETMCFKVSLDDTGLEYLTANYCPYQLNDEGYCCVYVGEDNYFEFKFKEDSYHNLEYYCVDHLGNTEMPVNIQWYKVDSTPPTTEKEYIPDPYIDDNGWEYIDTEHEIELTAEDGGEYCAIDDETTYYRYYLVADEMCEGNCICEYPPEEEVFDLTGDVAGTITKTDNGDSFTWTITITSPSPVHGKWAVGMPFAISTDQPAFQVWYREYETPYGWYYQEYTGTGWHGWGGDVIPVSSVAGITTTGDHNGQTFTITVDKSFLGGPCATFYWAVQARTNLIGKYPSTWNSWAGGSEEVSGMATALSGGYGNWNVYDVPFGISEESCHMIEFYSVDAIGNEEDIKYQCVFVDKQKPVTTKWYEGPQYPDPITDQTPYPHWIKSTTRVWLSAIDPEPHPSGVAKTFYKDVYLPDDNDWHFCYEDCGSWNPTKPADPKNPQADGWTEWTGTPFYKTPESCHIIEYYSIDNVGKVEDIKWQCVFVDDSAPEPDKKVGDPKSKWFGEDSYYYKDITGERCWKDETGSLIDTGTLEGDIAACRADPNCIECWRITLLTPIYLECIDPEPHPVNHETVCFYVEWDGDDVTDEYCDDDLVYDAYYDKDFCCVDHEMVFNFGETTEHELEYYCIDALGNKGQILDVEKFKVENTTFNITLNKKWNLISFPVFLLDETPAGVFKDIADKVMGVWTYDPEETLCGDLWCFWSPEDAGDNLENILPGWGYWVLMEDGAVLTIGGSLMRPGPVGMASKEIVPGWNLIGYYGTEGIEVYDGPDGEGGHAYCELYSLGEDLLDKELTGLWTYWEPDNPYQWKELDNMNRMDPGAGYWLTTPQAGLYTPTTSCGLGDLFNPHEIY